METRFLDHPQRHLPTQLQSSVICLSFFWPRILTLMLFKWIEFL